MRISPVKNIKFNKEMPKNENTNIYQANHEIISPSIDLLSIKDIGSQKKLIPETDKSKYNISVNSIISETNDNDEIVFILNDGRNIKYKKIDDNTILLSEITIKDNSGNIMETTKYDEFGNENYKKTYQYDELGKIKHIEIEDKINNELIKETYNNDKKETVDKIKNNKIVSKAEYDEFENIIYTHDYYYDTEGKMIANVLRDVKNTTITTNFYKNDNVYLSFPFDLMKSNGNFEAKGLEDYCNYSNTTRLSESITNLLTEGEISSINNAINENVNVAGKGTGEGVAAAAISLITGLKEKNILLPYYYSGGHVEGGPPTGINAHWGEDTTPNGISTYRSKNSLDCTGFVTWAIKTAGIDCAMINESMGTPISYSEAKAGSVLANSAHDILVVGTYEEDGVKHLICAEATGDGATEAKIGSSGDNEGGIIITDRTDANNYTIYDMDDYYEQNKIAN